ncbi:hypothetical protein ACHQM5_020625 [Ranunculus cassubicifolius]
MSSKKEDKAQVAAERIKAATLTAAKGLSRAQAERAATAAARNVNAYGQKEEGPSRWQERKEQKRQMYLMSTEKAVRLGERKDHSSMISNSSGSGSSSSQCQKCFQTGHWTYQCKNERVYISRPSRSQQLKNPKLKSRLSVSYEFDNPNADILPPKEDKIRVEKVSKSKRKHNSDSRSDSEASVFETDSGSSSDSSSRGSSDSYSSSSDSEEERRRRRRKKKSRRNYSSTSESSESETASDSDSDDKRSRRNKSRKHHKRR